MKGLVKIGKTTRDVSLRLADLYTTGVPLPFDCVYAAKVKDVDETEKAFHEAFEPSRINTKREFFEIKPSQNTPTLASRHTALNKPVLVRSLKSNKDERG